MRDASVPRIVCVTSLSGTTSKMGPVHTHLFDPLFFAGIYDDKRAQEATLASSGLEWVVVRPGRLNRRARHPDHASGPRGARFPASRRPSALHARSARERPVSSAALPYLVEPAFLPWHKVLTLGRD